MRLTEIQRSKLCVMMEIAFTHIRFLASTNRTEQAADLADAFHNLPVGMWAADFDFQVFREDYLLPYHEKYTGQHMENFLKMVDDVMKDAGTDSSQN